MSVSDLHSAAMKGDMRELGSLLRQKWFKTPVDINALDENGITALHYSAAKGHLPVVKILIEKGANLDVTSPQGSTALSAACFHGQLAITQCLLDAGADGGIADKVGFTPAWHARNRGHDEVFDLFRKIDRWLPPKAPELLTHIASQIRQPVGGVRFWMTWHRMTLEVTCTICDTVGGDTWLFIGDSGVSLRCPSCNHVFYLLNS